MSKLPENCPVCGEKMEKGYIAWSNSNIVWGKERAKWSFRGKENIISPSFKFSGIYNIKAFRCPNCKIVSFSYGEEKVK